ncbi:DUF1818 family protein [Oculatella sp. LEGE 06141]|uniref:DUF1818 family protein n=1 Tax=Oculatella sp. LEGE 06141 TaxID=1828648 RepID=UPI001882F173|nr:DUF1818 family protein [Oculatella sp. LEGE 06141]MBE9182373.1 DUF1818 family protein [Oculatella sp. LEGE 06141]
MARQIKSGAGWRIGWDAAAPDYVGLVGSDDWAIELTEAELNDFCRLIGQLAIAMGQMATELMDEEKISCEVESDLLWLEAEGYPHAFTLRLILHTGRRGEGNWAASAVSELARAAQTLKVF